MAIHPIMLSTLLADLVTHGEAHTVKRHSLTEMLLVGALPDEVSLPGISTRASMARPKRALLEARIHLDMVCWPLAKRGWTFSNAVKLGRDPSNDVVMAHPSVSKTHVRFSVGTFGLSVEDLKDGNATSINDQPVGHHRVPVKDGDRVTVGEMSLLVMSCKRLMKLLTRD